MQSGAKKEMLRAELLAARKELPEDVRLAESTAIHAYLTAHDRWSSAHTIVGYIATWDEVATMPLLRAAHKAGKSIVVPRMSAARICWHVLQTIPDETSLVRSTYGIYEPAADTPQWEYDGSDTKGVLWLIPGVGFDTRGNRLGRGGGHYDRALAASRSEICAIGLAFRMQIQTEIPHEENDIRMTHIVTADGWVECIR